MPNEEPYDFAVCTLGDATERKPFSGSCAGCKRAICWTRTLAAATSPRTRKLCIECSVVVATLAAGTEIELAGPGTDEARDAFG